MKVVLTNLPPDQATDIARKLVEERLAACVNILPVQSIYRWKGELCEEAECTLLIKTGSATSESLRNRLQELHPYDLPEIIALDISHKDSLMDYVQWVIDESTD
jgi:periplasmic divalent cation tolerance protein